MLVKLGGSVLTDKTRYRTSRPDVIARLAKECATAPTPLVVVHGGGSYGHVKAKEYGLKAGLTDARSREGFALVHADMRDLHQQVLRALQAAGIPAVGVPPFAAGRAEGGHLTGLHAEPFRDALRAGLTPVTFGDAVLDPVQGCAIVSGDTLMLHLARLLRPTCVLFVTNVDGLHDRDPATPGARLLDRVTPDALLGVAATEGAAPDVTGGMAGKARHMGEIARLGVPVQVVNGLVAGRLQDALAGKPVTGTEVRA
ncbi:MAG TPA: isopentenyl phosphate kinase [Candidatus Thermoplasmatota archaeon]|nr:isopentenyl phosphate kinase [Candidatus Thermoplasmatota archaeon]